MPTGDSDWNPPTPQNEGDSYSFGGETYYWNGNEWVTEYTLNIGNQSDGDMDYGGS